MTPPMNRRAFLALSAATLMPGAALSQQMQGPDFQSFAAAMRALSGFDAIPRDLLTGARDLLEPLEATALVDRGADTRGDLAKSVLRVLYTGEMPGRGPNGTPERIAYAESLMFACVEDALNVPSFCGGVPNYWQDPPEAM